MGKGDDHKLLTSDKHFVISDVDFKHFERTIHTFKIFREKSYLLSMLFYYRKIPIKILLQIKFLFVYRFTKFLLHILRQFWY